MSCKFPFCTGQNHLHIDEKLSAFSLADNFIETSSYVSKINGLIGILSSGGINMLGLVYFKNGSL